MSVLLFAYGSSMASAEMASWCPEHRFLGPARLDGHRLELRRDSIRRRGGAADIVPAPGESVWGALYELPEVALERLDGKEGVGFAYRRREVEVWLGDAAHAAQTYEVIAKEPTEVPCTREYAALLVSAGRERGLPRDYVDDLEGRLLASSGP